MDRIEIYDIIYALAARGGREEALFGGCGTAAREAFRRSLTGGAFPELWFEAPLAGEPWMDFHSLTSHGDVAGTHAAYAGHGGAYADALSWFAAQGPQKVRQLALSYDTSVGDVERPAVQLLVDGPNPDVPTAFLSAAGRPDLREAYDAFVHGMPAGWYACYVGVFPGREAECKTPWVRVECIVGNALQRAYAESAAVLREHLEHAGLGGVGEDAIEGVRELACSPFPLELRFNVGPNGTALPVLSASVRFQPRDWKSDGGREAVGRLAEWLQACGLADERCGLLAQAVFAKRMERGGERVTASCFPAFVKLRWREGMEPCAKAYLLVRVG